MAQKVSNSKLAENPPKCGKRTTQMCKPPILGDVGVKKWSPFLRAKRNEHLTNDKWQILDWKLMKYFARLATNPKFQSLEKDWVIWKSLLWKNTVGKIQIGKIQLGKIHFGKIHFQFQMYMGKSVPGVLTFGREYWEVMIVKVGCLQNQHHWGSGNYQTLEDF